MNEKMLDRAHHPILIVCKSLIFTNKLNTKNNGLVSSVVDTKRAVMVPETTLIFA